MKEVQLLLERALLLTKDIAPKTHGWLVSKFGLEFVDKIITMHSKNLKPVHDLPRPSDIKHSLADISSKAENELKYKPEYNLDNCLKETIWYFKGRGDEIATT